MANKKIKFLFIVTVIWGVSIWCQPSVTIIISLFEQSVNFEQCMKELVRQSYFPLTEVIAVMPQSYKADCMKDWPLVIRIVVDDDSSEAVILNAAIKKASGLYLMRWYWGDLHQKEMIQKRAEALDQCPELDVVYADFWWNHEPYKNQVKDCDIMRLPEFNQHNLAPCFPVAGLLWRRSLHEKYGLISEDCMHCSEWAFWRRVMNQGAIKCKKLLNPDFIHYINLKKRSYNDPLNVMQKVVEEKDAIARYPLARGVGIPEKNVVIIIPSYNNAVWVERNLHSIFMQRYANYRIIYINDASTDETYEKTLATINKYEQSQRCTVINNRFRSASALGNICAALSQCNDQEIALILDADDWLAHENVLARVNQEYADPNVWMTYGQFMVFPYGLTGWAHDVPDAVIKNNSIRSYNWCTTHLRTFYCWLFKHVAPDSLKIDGAWLPMAGDLALMMSLFEICAYHAHFIPDILYVYNRSNPINADKVNKSLQKKCEEYVRTHTKYYPLQGSI